MANRALMFELLEKQHLMSIFGALSGLLLFQDGVFANSFCDRLFAHIETDYDKITRSLHRNENSKFMKKSVCGDPERILNLFQVF